MYATYVSFTVITWLFTLTECENPSYDQGVYKPEFLNYCYEDREECKDVCGCMLDRKCMVRPVPPAVMEAILDKHNNIRKERLKSEPKASGMPRMEYDAQLEAIAQCWAAKCKRDVTDCLLTESYSEVGMNVGMIKIEEMNSSPFLESPYSDTKPLEELWKSILDSWAKEIDTLQLQQDFSKKEQPDVSRGAQMIHDQTLALGCAWSASPEGSFFFCVYGPGIKDNTTVYKSGPQCTTCPPGLKCTEDSEGLCVKYSLYPSQRATPLPPHGGGGEKEPPKAPGIRGGASFLVYDLQLLILNCFVALVLRT